jgi:hypothetical protein
MNKLTVSAADPFVLTSMKFSFVTFTMIAEISYYRLYNGRVNIYMYVTVYNRFERTGPPTRRLAAENECDVGGVQKMWVGS